MTKKVDVEEDTMAIDKARVWCPEAENFQYIKACEADCDKKDRCKPFRDYFEPRLF